MSRRFLTTFCLLILSLGYSYAQKTISGIIKDAAGNAIEAATVVVKGSNIGTSSNRNGEFSLQVGSSDSITLQIQHISFQTLEIRISSNNSSSITITLSPKSTLLTPVEISGGIRNAAGLVAISAKSIIDAPSAGNDISAVLKTLPGVISNNELSANYSVRGGNFDENLIFINEIPVYRPFLISNGRQEGLGTVNPDMLELLQFHSGGWGSRYGGKLSSVLLASYRKPTKNSVSVSGGLLGGNASWEIKKKNLGILGGIRYKSSQYLLNTLETKGEYQPRFADAQIMISHSLGKNTDVEIYGNFARNRYLVQPSNQTTEFGTFNQSFRLFVAFDGREIMNYDTWQGALNLSHKVNEKWSMRAVVSQVSANEEEFTDVEGGYRLCDIDRNRDADEDCITERGIGTNYRYARNRLDSYITDTRFISSHEISSDNYLEWGIEYKYVDIDDVVDEYSFIDSSDYVTDLISFKSQNQLKYSTTSIFFSQVREWRANSVEYGLRIVRPNLTGEWLFAPRLRLSGRIDSRTRFHLATGVYHQPPFYRELRAREGDISSNPTTQSSAHVITGIDKNLEFWGRPFEWKIESYYKYLWNSIPYDVENVRIRYLTDVSATGRIMGIDSRFGGEFIPGTESWFSLGVLSAKEDITGDEKGLIRKPTDQRLTLGILFRDYFPNNPSMRVSMNLQIGTGLPFGPPNDLSNRNIFTARIYRRFDIGFTKEFELKKGSFAISAEILNVLGVDNVITYSWIRDVVNQQIAVPNSLSGRFLNLQLRLSL